MQKLEALTRILEAETFDGMIIFARTKLGTEELATKLQARGFAATAINGDMAAAAARAHHRAAQERQDRHPGRHRRRRARPGRRAHQPRDQLRRAVDPESYTHRIGRTGRAGRSGEAILFITPRERAC
jgi:ATP-dependent RNA helicase DeaD